MGSRVDRDIYMCCEVMERFKERREHRVTSSMSVRNTATSSMTFQDMSIKVAKASGRRNT